MYSIIIKYELLELKLSRVDQHCHLARIPCPRGVHCRPRTSVNVLTTMIHPIAEKPSSISYDVSKRIRSVSKDALTKTQESSANNCVCLVVFCGSSSIPCYQIGLRGPLSSIVLPLLPNDSYHCW